MNKNKNPEWTGEDISNLARDMGRPLPSGMKGRIMARIDEEAVKMHRADSHEGRATDKGSKRK
jgi:hypothetical protein